MANSGQTVLSLTEILPHTVTSTGFYVPSCYRSCKNNLDFCFNRPHTARVVQQLLDANVIVLPWDHLGQRIRCHPNPPIARGHLVQALIQEWRSIPDAAIRRLTNCPTSGPCLHTCTWWTYTLLKRVLCGQIYSPSL